MPLITKLPHIRDGAYRENYDLSTINWFRVGGNAEVMFRPKNNIELQTFLQNKPNNINITVLGVGSNTIIRDGGIDGVVIRLGREFAQIKYHPTYDNTEHVIEAGAAALDINVALAACEHNISGMEFLVGIPGTIGGAIKMNAGAYGNSTSDILIKAEAFDLDGNHHIFTNSDLNFSYRHSDLKGQYIFTKAFLKGSIIDDSKAIEQKILQIKNDREQSQPIKSRTGGSTFKNPDNMSAWKLIDQAGCRGLKIGGAIMSEKHCNFMINNDTATAQDLEDLGNEVKKRVKEKTGVTLEWEIKIIGKTK